MRALKATFAAILGMFVLHGTASAQSPLINFPTIGTAPSVYPLPDPFLQPSYLWITQSPDSSIADSVDYKIDPLRLSATYVGPLAPRAPFQYELWLDTSASPTVLRRRLGITWAAEAQFSPSGGPVTPVAGLTNAHLFVGNSSNLAADVAVSGDLTLANTGAFTIADGAVTTSKIADGAVTPSKLSGDVVYSTGAGSILNHIAVFDDTTGRLITESNNTVDGTVSITAANGTAGLVVSSITGLYGIEAGGAWTSVINIAGATGSDAGLVMGAPGTTTSTIKWDTGITLSTTATNGGRFVFTDNVGTSFPLIMDDATVTLGSPLKLPTKTVATLPACSGTTQNLMYLVTDALGPTYGGTLTGGGAIPVPAVCDGTDWRSV